MKKYKRQTAPHIPACPAKANAWQAGPMSGRAIYEPKLFKFNFV